MKPYCEKCKKLVTTYIDYKIPGYSEYLCYDCFSELRSLKRILDDLEKFRRIDEIGGGIKAFNEALGKEAK